MRPAVNDGSRPSGLRGARMACQGPGAEPALRAPPPYRLRYNAATDYLSLERSHRPMTPDLQGANLDTCSIAEEGGNDGDARQMVAPSPTSAAAQASGVQTRQSALAAAAGRMYASVAGKGKAAPASAGAAVGAHEHKANGSADAGPAGTRHHTDSPTPHARSVGSEATWGPHHDRERSRPRSFTPQPWISGTSGESSLIAEPALDRLRASPAPNGGGLFAQQTGGGRAGASWMREPARESASPMSRIQTAAPAGPAAAEGRASISRQPSGGLLAPPSAVTWRSGTPSALAREPRRMNTLSIESVSASAAGSPGLRASHSPPPTQAGCPEAAPSLPSLPPPAPTPAPKRQRPPRAADVAAAAREAAAEAGGARGSSRGRAAVPTDAAHQPLAPIGESDGADEGGDAAAACGTADDEHDHGHQRIGISKDAAGLWQITLKVWTAPRHGIFDVYANLCRHSAITPACWPRYVAGPWACRTAPCTLQHRSLQAALYLTWLHLNGPLVVQSRMVTTCCSMAVTTARLRQPRSSTTSWRC